jgi:hypothetical protein
LQIFRAERDGRLIWRGAESFAVLQRPADRGAGWGLRWIDRQWPAVVMLVGLMLFAFVALAVTVVLRISGRAPDLYLSVLLIVYLSRF